METKKRQPRLRIADNAEFSDNMNYADYLLHDKLHDASELVLNDEWGRYSKIDYPFQEEMYKIIGACMEVHTVLGRGFLESVYHESLCIELTKRGIPFESKKVIHVFYKEVQLQKTFEADIFAFGHIIVELKALEGSLDPHQAQLINYLSASRHVLGLLVNFGMPSLQYRRFIVSKNQKYNQL